MPQFVEFAPPPTALAEIIDTTTSATYSYHCEAAPGTASSAAAWRCAALRTPHRRDWRRSMG